MVLTITQFGGGWGNTAGDCCLIQWDSEAGKKSHILIDLGRASMFNNMNEQCKNSTLRGVILTHLHSDHIGGTGKSQSKSSMNWNLESTLSQLNEDRGFLVLPKYTDFSGLKAEIKKKVPNCSIYSDPQASKDLLKFEDIEDIIGFNIECIYPDLSQAYKERENCHSLGCLITVTHNSSGKDWRMLTLGDMENVDKTTNQTANAAIEEVVGVHDINVIKLAHHGSASNLMDTVKKIIDTCHPIVVISGYTGGGIEKLVKHTEKAKKVYFLFSQAEVEDTAKSGLSIKGFIYPSAYKSPKTKNNVLKRNFDDNSMDARREQKWKFVINEKKDLDVRCLSHESSLYQTSSSRKRSSSDISMDANPDPKKSTTPLAQEEEKSMDS